MKNNDFDPGLSVYLDLVRFLAAAIVLLSHTWNLVFPSTPLPWPGHSAVVVFFVLSGYVIGHVCARPGTTVTVYARHRAVRILSVSLPALVLAIAIAPFVGTAPIHAAGDMAMDNATFWRAIWTNVFFLGQIWTNNNFAPYNVPFWSLTYEVWFYAIFGAWKFGASHRVVLTLILAAIAGPLILLLMPVWLLGVALSRRMPRLSERGALALFAATLILGFAFFWTDLSINIREFLATLFPHFIGTLNGSNQFVGDFLLGLIVSAHFIAVASLDGYLKPLLCVGGAIRTLASFTLSSYLYHLPLTVLLWGGLGIRSPLLFYTLLAGGIILFGSFTERRVYFFRRQLDRVWRPPAIAV